MFASLVGEKTFQPRLVYDSAVASEKRKHQSRPKGYSKDNSRVSQQQLRLVKKIKERNVLPITVSSHPFF